MGALRSPRERIRYVMIVACLLVLGAAPADPVPFTTARGRIVVATSVGEAPPRPFAVDAGLDWPVLDAATARTLGLTVGADAQTILPTLRIGGLRLAGTPAVVADLSGLQRTLGTAVAGILPAQLAAGVLTLDFGRGTLSYLPETGLPGGGAHAYSVAMQPGSEGPELRLSFGGERLYRGRIDLGFSGDVGLPEALARELGLLEPGMPRLEVEAAEGSSPDGRVQVRARTVEVGGAALRRPLCTVRETGDTPVLGTGFLKHFVVRLDFAAGRMLLDPIDAAAPEGTPVAGYGLLLGDRVDGLWGLMVAVNSPAYRAGVKPGDRLEAVAGESVKDKGYGEVSQLLAADPGRSTRITVRRGDEQQEFDLTAESLL